LHTITLTASKGQVYDFGLYADEELPRLSQSIQRLVPVPQALRLEDDYETDEEMLSRAQADVRKELKAAINKKLDRAL
jgi:hypothetical protein